LERCGSAALLGENGVKWKICAAAANSGRRVFSVIPKRETLRTSQLEFGCEP